MILAKRFPPPFYHLFFACFPTGIDWRYHLLNNYVYFDTLGVLAQQTGIPISIAQLIIQKDFRVGSFHLIIPSPATGHRRLRSPAGHLLQTQPLETTPANGLRCWMRVGVDLRFNNFLLCSYYNPVTTLVSTPGQAGSRILPYCRRLFSACG